MTRGLFHCVPDLDFGRALSQVRVFAAVLVGLGIAVVSAGTVDPFRRVRLAVLDGAMVRHALAVLPRHSTPRGILVCAGLPAEYCGKELRHIAEQNIVAVAWEEEPANAPPAKRTEMMLLLRAAVAAMPWANGLRPGLLVADPDESVAQLYKWPDEAPSDVLVHITTNWWRELKPGSPTSALVHPAANESGSRLQVVTHPPVVTLRCVNIAKEERMELIRVAAEAAAMRWSGQPSPLSINEATRSNLSVILWLGLGGLGAAILYSRRAPGRGWTLIRSDLKGGRVVIVAAFAGILALYGMGHISIDSSEAGAHMRAECRRLSALAEIEVDEAIVEEHVRLAQRQRSQFYENIDSETFSNYVLNPVISASSGTRWRRMLWRTTYPHVRNSRDAVLAARTMVAYLRSRVTVVRGAIRGSVEDAWRSGITDTQGFEALYVAALRAVGIAARLDATDNAELLAGQTWVPAPRPLIMVVYTEAE